MTIAADQLRKYVQRLERIEEEIDNLKADKREIYGEAKSNGFDKTALGEVMKMRRRRAKDEAAFQERNELVKLYWHAVEGDDSHAHAHAREEQPKAEVAA